VAEAEAAMRTKAATVGNLVYKDVPVSDDEVRRLLNAHMLESDV
jgi:hypothetical protein